MSNRRERRRSESQQPLSEIKDIENIQEGKVTHGKRKPRRSSRTQGKQRFALTPLQSEATNPSALVSGGSTPKEKQMAQSKLKFPTKQKDGLKHRDIHRREQKSSSPALPEIPVTFNKDGRLEVVSDFDTITQVEFGVQTDIMECEDKAIQTETPMEESTDYRMCTEEIPPLEYWKELAEQRRLALVETLDENEQLYAEIDRLKVALKDQETQQQQSEYFSFMYKLSSSEQEQSTKD